MLLVLLVIILFGICVLPGVSIIQIGRNNVSVVSVCARNNVVQISNDQDDLDSDSNSESDDED